MVFVGSEQSSSEGGDGGEGIVVAQKSCYPARQTLFRSAFAPVGKILRFGAAVWLMSCHPLSGGGGPSLLCISAILTGVVWFPVVF